MKTPQPSLFDDAAWQPPRPAHPRSAPEDGAWVASSAATAGQLSLFDGQEPLLTVTLPEGYRLVDTPEALRELVRELDAASEFALDTETTDLDPYVAELVGLSFSATPGKAAYVPVGHSAGRQLERGAVLDALRPVLEDPSRQKIGHHLKFDMRILERAGIRLGGFLWDTMIAAQLVREEGGHGLKECVKAYLGRDMEQFQQLTARGGRPLREIDIAAVGRYACDDAEATLALKRYLQPEIDSLGLGEVFDLEAALLPVVARMETDGIGLDTAYLGELARQLQAQMEEKARACYEAVGSVFNLNSPKQIAAILYERLRLPVTRTTATGPSTDEAALRELAARHPLPALLLEYRELSKLLTTYAQALPRAVSSVTGRVHPSFHQVGARSGRFSCANPNLQNLPKDSANTIRRAFVAAPGHVLLSADYSQIELRVLAHVSGDPALLAAFAADEDVHARTAAGIFGVALDAVTPEQRRVAKGINFGLVYGMSAQGLAAQLGITLAEAERYVDAYFARYGGVRRYMAETLRNARKQGYVTTLLGRRRHVGKLNAPDARLRGQAERQAINAPIQGTAADIIKRAMIRLAPRLPRFGARMVLQVHDELVIEVPEGHWEPCREVVITTMEEMPLSGFRVPLRVQTHADRAWN